MKPAHHDENYYRAAFLLVGLTWGRHFGTTLNYVRKHPRRFMVANACVLTSDGTCVWRGDLDLATTDDQRGLISVSRLLRLKLHITRELTDREIAALPRGWLQENAVATVYQGKVSSAGYYRQLYGSCEQIADRYASTHRPNA